MKSNDKTFALTTLTATLLSISGAVGASDEDDELDLLISPTSSITIGVGHWSGEREQLGVFDDLRGDETVILLDGDIRWRDDETGTWMIGRFRDLGVDTRDVELRYKRQGDWGVGLDYYQIPRVAPYTVNTGVEGLGSDEVTVPSSIVPGTGRDLDLKTERRGIAGEFNKYLTPHLNFRASFKNEEKEGNRHWGYRQSRGGEVVFVTEPIDNTTRQAEAAVDYAGKQFQWTGGYYGSWFDTKNALLKINDPSPGSPYYLSMPLDNQAHQFYVNGGYNFTSTMRGTFRVSYTHATQDETIPTSGLDGPSPGFPQAASAPTNLDGEINTSLVQLGLSARPMDKLSVIAKLRYHDVDEKTPDWLVSTGTPVHSTPYDYETLSGKFEGTYRFMDGYRVVAGIDHKTQNRSQPRYETEHYVPYRDELNETTFRVQLRKSLSETLNGSLAFLHSERDGSDLTPAATHVDFPINPVHIADRDRDKVRLTLDWVPTNRIGLQFNVEDSRDDYGPGSDSNGLRNGKARLYSVDVDYMLSEDWRLAAWLSYDQVTSEERVGGSRTSHLKDIGKSAGLSLDGKASEKLILGADIEWTRVNATYDDTPSGSPELPDIRSTTTKLGFFAEYAVEKHADIRLDVMYQRWRTNDWAWTFSDESPFVYGVDDDGTSVIQDPNQSGTFVGLSYRYTF